MIINIILNIYHVNIKVTLLCQWGKNITFLSYVVFASTEMFYSFLTTDSMD